MEKYDLVVIGSGASGLVSAIMAMREGVKDVLIIEKEEDLGGNLNLFIHDGFGSFYLGKKVTGPEFASIMINDYKELGGKYLTSSKVLEIDSDKK